MQLLNNLIHDVRGKYTHLPLRQIMWIGGSRILAAPLGLVINVLLVRALGNEDFGRYALFITYVSIAAAIIVGGAPTLLTREVARYSSRSMWAYCRGLLVFSFGVSGLSAGLLGASSVMTCHFLFNGRCMATFSRVEWALLSTTSIAIASLLLAQAILKGLKYSVIADVTLQLLRPAILLSLVVICISLGEVTLHTALLSQLIAVSSCVIFLYLFIYNFDSTKLPITRRAYKTRGWLCGYLRLLVVGAVSAFSGSVGVIALGVHGDMSAIAIFKVAESITVFVGLSLVVVNAVVAPLFVKALVDKDMGSLEGILREASKVAFIFALAIAIALVVFGNEILRFFFDEGAATRSYEVMLVLGLGSLFNVFFGPVGNIMLMAGRELQVFAAQFLGLVISFVLASWLVPAFGAVGAAIGVSSGLIFWNIVLCYRLKKALGVRALVFV